MRQNVEDIDNEKNNYFEIRLKIITKLSVNL